MESLPPTSLAAVPLQLGGHVRPLPLCEAEKVDAGPVKRLDLQGEHNGFDQGYYTRRAGFDLQIEHAGLL